MLDFSYHMDYCEAMTSPGIQKTYSQYDSNSSLFTSPRSSFRQKKTLLTLERLQSLTPIVQETDVAAEKARNLFISHLRTQKNVRSVFFPNHKPLKEEVSIDPDWFDFECFSTIFVLDSIIQIKDHFKIHTLIRKHKLEDFLSEIYQSSEWKKVGLAFYSILAPDTFRDTASGTTLRQFMNDDSADWARQLSERTLDTQWLFSVMRNIARGQYNEAEYNRDMNILFIKLHLLDPKSVMPTYQQLRKALPDLNLELVTTNYLGGPLDWTLIKDDVTDSINKNSFSKNSSNNEKNKENNAVLYGAEVVEFIMREAKDLDLWTGKFPENRRLSKFSDHCVII